MVIQVKVDIRNRQAINKINKKVIKLPKAIGDAGFEFSKRVQMIERLALTRGKNIFTGKAWNSIKAIRRSKFVSEVKMSQRAFWLDSMRTHFVQLKMGRNIHKWALAKGSNKIKRIAMREGFITVRAHPFVADSIATATRNLKSILQRHADKALGG